MIKSIIMPAWTTQKYWDSHYKFFLQLSQAAGVNVYLRKMPDLGRGFLIFFKGKKAFIDFGDHKDNHPNFDEFPIVFRFHYTRAQAESNHCFPLTPISFYEWDKYFELKGQIVYRAQGNKVLNCQKPGKAALERRSFVQKKLLRLYSSDLDTAITDQVTYWKKIQDCLVSVCIPGARNDILDRGQLQYFGFGACTIAPEIDIKLPYWRIPEPGVHYIACRPDYSDLEELIESCRYSRELCKAIGQNAKALFNQTCTPERVWTWINKCIEETL